MNKKTDLPMCHPGYGCLTCPYKDCLRPYSQQRRNSEESLMLRESGMTSLWRSIGILEASKRKKRAKH